MSGLSRQQLNTAADAGEASRQRLACVTQIGVCLAFSQWHMVARFLVAGDATIATTNATWLIEVESRLGLYREVALQRFFLGRPLLADAAKLVYSLGHAVVPVATLVALWRSDRERYRYWRNALAWMCVLAVGVFAVWPLLPPRLLPPPYGFVDLLAREPVLDVARPFAPALHNAYAAMPSLHMGFAMWACLALRGHVRSPMGRVMLVAYPFLMTLAVVATGNHYFLDVVGAGGVLAAAVMITGRRMRDRVRKLATMSPTSVSGDGTQPSARRAQLALVGLIALVWVPKAQFGTALVDALVVLSISALLRRRRLHAGRPAESLTQA